MSNLLTVEAGESEHATEASREERVGWNFAS